MPRPRLLSDARVLLEAGAAYTPYSALIDVAKSHSNLISQACRAVLEEPGATDIAEFWAALNQDRDLQEIIQRFRQLSSNWGPDFDSTVIQAWMRMSSYPSKFIVDKAVTVAITGFFKDLVQSTDVPKAAQISEALPFFDPEYASGETDRTHDPALYLPLLLIKNQSEGDEPDEAVRHEMQISVSSAARFLELFGITEFPVYGLMTCGQYGYLLQAWCSAENKVSLANLVSGRIRVDHANMLVLLCHGSQYPAG